MAGGGTISKTSSCTCLVLMLSVCWDLDVQEPDLDACGQCAFRKEGRI